MKHTRKIAAAVLAALLVFCLTACGSSGGKMEQQLVGTWTVTMPSTDGDSSKALGVAYAYDENGDFTISAFVGDMTLGSEYGTYEITDDAVVATKENGEEVVCTYEFEGGTLTMYAPNGQEMTKSE